MNPLVKNAADPIQVKKAQMKSESVRNEELKDLREVLQMESGRRFIWRLLAKFKAFSSVWEPSARIHFLAGQQDCAHYIMAEMAEADEESFLKLMKENYKPEKERN